MKALHLFANWKWTGPAEPAVNLAAALRARRVDVRFACGRSHSGLENQVEAQLAVRNFEPTRGLRLGKHRHPIMDPIDRRAMKRLLREVRPDVLHCHLPNDHRIGAGAAASLKHKPKIVRSLYDGDTPRADKDLQWLVGPGSDAVLCVSRRVTAELPERAGIDADKVFHVEGAVDLDRFEPRGGVSRMAREYGIEKGDFVVGIVARMQRHRRFDVFFESLARVAEAVPNLKVLLVGRGTWMEEVAVKPAARKELAGKVIFTGYRRGSEYVETVRCMSTKIYLMPGSDGSCRAVREALALGVPVVAARRGMLDEIVLDDQTGYVVDDEPEPLSEAVIRIAKDETLRKRLSRNARDRAKECFGLPAQARRVAAIYKWLLDDKAKRPPTTVD